MPPAIDGFYAAYLTGVSGQGFMMLIFRKGVVVGVDVSSGTIDGTYSADDLGYDLHLTIKLPPNIQLIQGGNNGANIDIETMNVRLPHNFLSEDFITVQARRGAVNVKLVKLRDIEG